MRMLSDQRNWSDLACKGRSCEGHCILIHVNIVFLLQTSFKMISYVLPHLLCLLCVCSARPQAGEWRLMTPGWECHPFIPFRPLWHSYNSRSHTDAQTLPAFLQQESVCGVWLLLRQPLLHGVILKKCIPASKIKAEFMLSSNGIL